MLDLNAKSANIPSMPLQSNSNLKVFSEIDLKMNTDNKKIENQRKCYPILSNVLPPLPEQS